MRVKGEVARVDFALQLRNPGLEDAAFDRHPELRDPQVEQLVVGPRSPFVRRYRPGRQRGGGWDLGGHHLVGRGFTPRQMVSLT